MCCPRTAKKTVSSPPEAGSGSPRPWRSLQLAKTMARARRRQSTLRPCVLPARVFVLTDPYPESDSQLLVPTRKHFEAETSSGLSELPERKPQTVNRLINPDPREDLESRSPNLGPYTTKGYFIETPIKVSTFWLLPKVWVNQGVLIRPPNYTLKCPKYPVRAPLKSLWGAPKPSTLNPQFGTIRAP